MKRSRLNFNCMEVLAVRLFHSESGGAVTDLFNGLKVGNGHTQEGVVGLSLYSYSGLASDWKIDIHRDVPEQMPQKTALGLHIASALSAIGLVHHEVWCCSATINNTIHRNNQDRSQV